MNEWNAELWIMGNSSNNFKYIKVWGIASPKNNQKRTKPNMKDSGMSNWSSTRLNPMLKKRSRKPISCISNELSSRSASTTSGSNPWTRSMTRRAKRSSCCPLSTLLNLLDFVGPAESLRYWSLDLVYLWLLWIRAQNRNTKSIQAEERFPLDWNLVLIVQYRESWQQILTAQEKDWKHPSPQYTDKLERADKNNKQHLSSWRTD